MNQNEHALPQARTTEIVTKDMPDEVLVYDLKTHKAHCLNQTAAAVWKYCDGKTSVAEIAAQMKNDLNLTVDKATIWLAVERLSRADLLEIRITVPAGSSRQSRRETIKRLGMGFAVSVPLVMSVVAPAAAAAASGCEAPGVCRSGLALIGSAAECQGCADVLGTCYGSAGAPTPGLNCPGTGPSATTTCAGCIGSAVPGVARSWRSL